MSNNIFTTIYTKPCVSNLPRPREKFVIAKNKRILLKKISNVKKRKITLKTFLLQILSKNTGLLCINYEPMLSIKSLTLRDSLCGMYTVLYYATTLRRAHIVVNINHCNMVLFLTTGILSRFKK